jgi:SAM-dependent methyltransferase
VPPVGLCRTHVVPRLVDRACAAPRFDRWRARATDGLCGRVIEIGFGSGLNVRHYPSDVEVILAVEPSTVAWRIAQHRLGTSSAPVSRGGLDGQRIPLEDASSDAALITFTLCTVPDPTQVLSELRRVLRPGGAVHFVEHGLSPDAGVAHWQHRIEPLRCGLAGGCHLTREPTILMDGAGLVMEWTDEGYAGGSKLSSWLTAGVATTPMA